MKQPYRMEYLIKILKLVLPVLFLFTGTFAQRAKDKKIHVFVLGSTDKNHSPMVAVAEPMFIKMAAENNFDIHFTRDTAEVNSQNLKNYQVFIQLSIAYFDLSASQQAAIEQFVTSGKGWIGIHGAGLIGKMFVSPTNPAWEWFWHLMGDAYYRPHPPLQEGELLIENHTHPVTKNLPESFTLTDEWYEFEQAPVNALVLAVADEESYKPKIPMGFHPAIWINPEFRRALYISVGHDPSSCSSEPYKILLRDAIKWAASTEKENRK